MQQCVHYARKQLIKALIYAQNVIKIHFYAVFGIYIISILIKHLINLIK